MATVDLVLVLTLPWIGPTFPFDGPSEFGIFKGVPGNSYELPTQSSQEGDGVGEITASALISSSSAFRGTVIGLTMARRESLNSTFFSSK